MFLSHLIKLRKLKGDIKFCAMSDEVRNVLSVLGVGKLLVVKPTLREALDDFAEAEEPAQKVKDSQKLRIEVHEEGSVTVFGLVGFVDRETIAQLDGQLSEALRTDRAQIVIDCAKLSYISSNGMGVFISYVNKARQQGGDIRLCNLKDVARTVITMLGLQRLFKVYETLDAAIASY